MQWGKLTDRIPNPDEHGWVLIYTEQALPEFKFNESGFLIAGEHEAPFTCKYCGMPSWTDPSDQSPPPDCCHEIDHGTAEDRAAHVSSSLEL